jgi:iron complex outermembrane receptor protein
MKAIKNAILAGSILATTAGTVFAQTAATPATPAAPSGAASTNAPPVTPGGLSANGGAAPAATTAGTQEMAPVYITGSAIPTTDNEGSSPVTMVDSATIQKRGYQTAEDVIKHLTANGSFSNPGQTSGNFAAGAAYASLRGLGPQATLVLINGRRVSSYAAAANGQYAFVDLNNIPAEIIDHIEVLTDGTAIYGSDAVAGVINIITKTDLGPENGEVDAYIGNTDSYDSFTQRYTVMGNLSSFDKNGYGVVEADYEHQNSIFATDRQISQTANQSVNGGADLRSGRYYPGLFQGETTGNLFSILPGTGNVPLTGTVSTVDPSVDDNANALQPYDYNPATSIIPDQTRYGMYMNYSYKFYDGTVTPHVDFAYRHNRTILTQAAGGYSFFDGDTGPNPNNIAGGDPAVGYAAGQPAFTVPTTNPYNRTGEVIDVLAYRFVPYGPRIEDVDSDVFRVVPSLDIKLGDGWTLNLGFNYNYTWLNDRNINFPSAAGFQNALNSTDPATAYNPFTSEAGQTPGAIAAISATSGNRDVSSLIAEDFRLNGKLFDLPAGPVQMAFGGEYRVNRYTNSYDQADTSGDVIASSVQQDTAAKQRALSGYVEIDIPITSPTFNCPGVYSLDADIAGRVDKYSQFGTTQNPQVRLRWEPVQGLVVRGGYSTEFRAPSLVELAAGGNQAFQTVFDPVTGTAPEVLVNSPGNPKLQPETAETFQGGVAWSPSFFQGFKVTADYFHIRYSQQIQQTDAQELINEDSPLVVRNSVGNISSVTATYVNLPGSTTVDGIDMGFQYVVGDPFKNLGQLTLTVNTTYMLDYTTESPDPTTGSLVKFNNVGYDSAGVGPYSRFRQDITATWDYRNFSFTLSSDFASGYRDSNGLDANFEPIERSVADYLTFDLQASYEFDKEEVDKWIPGPKANGFDWRGILAGTRFAVGCNNIYDTQPPFTANTSDTLGYDPDYADPTGRFIYASISKKF